MMMKLNYSNKYNKNIKWILNAMAITKFVLIFFSELKVKMKLLAIFALCFALAAALPTPSEPEVSEIQPKEQPEQQQESLVSADANPQGDNADRSKRFIFFSKIFYPYPIVAAAPVATPVVTPIVTKTVAVAPAPVVTYAVKPVTYQYTYSIPSFTVVKAAPVVVASAVPTAEVTVTKTAAVATNVEESKK